MKKALLVLCCATSLFAIRPVPWVTDGANEFLEEFFQEHPDAKVLEFGSGASTVWFSKKTKHLYSVEHNPSWHKLVVKTIRETPECNSANCYLRKRPYYSICDSFKDETFDLILVDGRNRKGCILSALPKLKKGGYLMLDNSERPYYFAAFKPMEAWSVWADKQRKPDVCGFIYPGWETRWWQKPL
ncbi:class I SAM-dependent methyltransferase [bacterium]|nr:class I SAM-dependent methyltransferase [bacterium]